MSAAEVNFDGIVGPTHNYGGLSVGNEASMANMRNVSNPRAAALQGLEKMRLLHDLGVPQAVVPPQERPAMSVLRRLGFHGSDQQIISSAARHAPQVLAACTSASAMWTANAATVSPGADSADGRVHFTPANLTNKFHRSFESAATSQVLQRIFADEQHFAHHRPIPGNEAFGDEGAANHTRLCDTYDSPGVELFVFGKAAFDTRAPAPHRYPARQTLEASEAVARLHGLEPRRVVFAQQNPDAIDAGVFHNDVIAVGNRNVFLYHEDAFVDTPRVLDALVSGIGKTTLQMLVVERNRIDLEQLVRSYLFNSQLVSLNDERMLLLLPGECAEIGTVRRYLEELLERDNPIGELRFVDLRQSMRNGGGPACLRLRVALTDAQRIAMHQGVMFDAALHQTLKAWVTTHYRDRLPPEALTDPQLLDESRRALDELSSILGLGSIYPFQRQ